ncbi:MAG TPA: LCP family protein [Acidimicrobiales bacterium]|nr:LCP family protein [Acidimicrobiales bacterium]
MRKLVAALLALLTLPTFWALDASLDRADAGVLVQKVETTGDARYDPGRWKDLTFVLLIGSDERPGLDGARGDALHVVALNPTHKKATMINIPRDTWVEIPGRGQGRINEAYHFGGAQLQAETVSRLVGAPIHYTVTTTFAGLVAMVDAMGGLEIDVPYPMDDPNSGAAFHQGRAVYNGTQVLAFSRNRHIPDGDMSRTAHQGQVIIHALASLRQRGTSGTQVLGYLDVLFRNVRTEGISPTDLYRLGRTALSVDPADVRNYTVPSQVGMRGAASVVFVRPQASALFADFADDGILQSH